MFNCCPLYAATLILAMYIIPTLSFANTGPRNAQLMGTYNQILDTGHEDEPFLPVPNTSRTKSPLSTYVVYNNKPDQPTKQFRQARESGANQKVIGGASHSPIDQTNHNRQLNKQHHQQLLKSTQNQLIAPTQGSRNMANRREQTTSITTKQQAKNTNVPSKNNHQFAATNGQAQFYGQQQAATIINGNSQHMASGSEYDVPVIVASGNNLVESQIFDPQQPMALQSSGQDQFVNSFYVSGFGTQPLTPQILTTNGINMGATPGHHYSGSSHDGLYGGAQQNYYNPDQGPYVAYDNHGDNQYRGDQYNMQDSPSDHRQSKKPDDSSRDDQESAEKSEPAKKKKMLTNDQLMSLIDELKEFNSKEASKMSSAVQPNGASDGSENDRDNEAGAITIGKIETSIEARKYDNEPQKLDDDIKEISGGGSSNSNDKLNKDDDVKDDKDEKDEEEKAKNDDLAKFAKFLLTKEGANMRFQLGLERDHPDDGDGDEDDDKDQLLESKARPTLKDERLSKKQLEVKAQLDRFVDDLAKMQLAPKLKINKNKQTGRKRYDKEDSFGEPKDMENDSDRARKRRDHAAANHYSPTSVKSKTGNSTSANPINRSQAEKGHHDNFTKLLIKSELLDDKIESAQDKSARKNTSTTPVNGAAILPTAESKVMRRTQYTPASLSEDELDMTPKKGEYGQKKEKYSKDERQKDKASMMNKIQRVRAARAKLRSRVPVPVPPIVKRALDGELNMKVEHIPKGGLLVRNNKDEVMKFKLPKKRSAKGGKNKRYQNDGRLDDSAPIPAQIEPETGQQYTGNFKIQSDKRLKDEYPISESVSDRLNKLSHQMDKYFNDGFLQEVEAKSKLQDKENVKVETHQGEPTNHNELSKPTKQVNSVKGKVTSSQKDPDFDINMGVDGKRDADKDEDDLDRRIDSDKDDDDEEEGGDGEALRLKNKSNDKLPTKGDGRKKGTKVQRSGNMSGSNNHEMYNKPQSKDKRVKTTRKNQTSNDGEDFEFENLGKLIDNMDPVENETLDTPIGPDSVNIFPVAKKYTKDENKANNHAKKTKLFQEPD